MKTFQCDRCKKQFNQNLLEKEMVGDYKIYLIESAAIEKKHTAIENPLCLCEDCKKALREFMKKVASDE